MDDLTKELADALKALLFKCDEHFAGDFSYDWPERHEAQVALANYQKAADGYRHGAQT